MVKIKDTQKSDKPKKKYPHAGHRTRLRGKFLKSGLDAFHDYEIVELLLTLGTPLKDCKDMAKDLMKKFKKLKNVLDASLEELQEIKGIGPMNAFGIKLFQSMAERYAKEKISSRDKFNSPEAVAEYLKKRIGREKKEHFIMLYLDTRNKLIVDSVSIGTLNANLVHPREVFRNAIQASAAQIIVAHNHPSDDPEPSPEDVALTRRLDDTAKIIDIELLDHIIVAKSGFTSLKERGLM